MKRLVDELETAVDRQIRDKTGKRPVIKRRCRSVMRRLDWDRRSDDRITELKVALEVAGLIGAPDVGTADPDDWVYFGYDPEEVLAAAAPKKLRSALEKSLVGPAGEHFVLYQLYRRGLLASLAPPGTPVVDILVLDLDAESVKATIQVKTRIHGSGGGWIMGKKHESLVDRRMFYAFVDLERQHPVTYVVPSSVVGDVITKGHQAWLDRPGARGQPHKDGPIRQLIPSNPFPGWLDEYCEAWDLIVNEVAERNHQDGDTTRS